MEFTIFMGSVYLHEVTPYTLQYNVQELVPHPDFSLTPLQNDLGLLFIDGMIPANYPTVAPIPLNQVTLNASVNCSVTGWSIAGKVSSRSAAESIYVCNEKSSSLRA